MKHYGFRNTALLRRSAGSNAGLILSAVFAALTVSGIWFSNKAHASTTFTVTNIDDNGGVNPASGAGTGTLRQAIVDANATSGTDTIDFNIPGSGVHKITLEATLPAITGTVLIDGYTQPGNGGPNAHPNTLPIGDDAVLLIQLDSSPGLSFGLLLSSSGSTIKGLVISRFGDDLVRIDGTGNTIVGNFIGTDPTGTMKVNAVGDMIQVNGSGNTIGGTAPADRNIVAGGGFTVFVPGGADNTVIQGNYIGVDVSGNVAIPAALDGVAIGSSGNTIGGSAAGAGNVIVTSGPDNVGLRFGANNLVQGNLIGTNATGTAALGGVNQGIIGEAQVGSATIIGNLISNANTGISVTNASNWTIRGNKIGTDITGTLPIPNNNGVLLNGGSSSIVGGTGAGEGNVIAFNTNDGVLLSGAANGESIRGNSIFSNGHLGINLIANTDPSPPGVTANDACDIDSGPNNLQNFPVINSAIKSGNDLLIEGTLDSTASSTFTLDFYTNDTCDPLGNGEGKTYLGSANVVTGANCIADFTGANKITLTPLAPVASGLRLTATATDANGNTSEFSACSGPTAIQLVDCTATAYDDGILLEWKTAHEVDNLGFNIFREENGNRVRVNRHLIAGSALLVGPSIRLGAGYSYAWKDATPDSRNAAYWLEDVDLKGGSRWHGPVAVQRSDLGSHKSAITTAVLLSDVGKEGMRNSSSRLEARAKMEFAAPPAKSQAALASQPAVKIAVKHEGWYRVTQLELAALGVDTRINPRMLQLFVDGRELPIVVQGEQDGSFDQADYIEFYGIGLDSPFTDSRVYWLIAGDRPGLRVIPSKFEGAPSSSESFTATAERRDRIVYFSALRNGEKENFFGAVIAANPVEQTLTLSHLAATSNCSAELEIALQGVTFTSHRINIELNGTWVGEITFNGQSQGAAKFNVDQSLLREGENVVRLSPLGGQSDISLVDYLRVSYQHAYIADGDSLKLPAAGKEQISIDGFASKTIRVFDVTDANSPQELIGKIDQTKNGYRVSLSSAADGQRNLLCISNGTRPASLAINLPSSLRDLNARYLIITRRDFFESLNPLVALHQRQGLSVAVIDIEDIYDELSFGQKTPYAVREFLAQARTNWKKKARFVVFAGDASLDPKNYLGRGDSDFVPTKLIDTQFLETSSDDWFSDFNGDGIADIASGRLPARTAEELISIVSKIIQYEHSSASHEALLVADADEGFAFEQACSELISLIPTNLRITQVYRGRLDAEKARGSLFEALYREQFLVNYVGHGSVNLWSGNLLTSTDAQDLQNEHLPMFVMMTCLNGYFHDPALDSLGESLIKAERGGAIAVWASSGMTMPSDQALINKELYRLLFNRDSALSLGEAVMRAKSSSPDADVRRTWILLGDPAIVLR